VNFKTHIDLLLVNPGVFSGTRGYGSMLHEPTMGLYLLREYLSEQGFKIDILDGTFQIFDDAEILKKAQISKVIGFYSVYTNMQKIFKISSLIKQEKSDAVIIAGGPNWPAGEEILMTGTGIDIVVKENAEDSVRNILLQLRDNGYITPESIKGIFYRSGKIVIDTGNSPHSFQVSKLASVQFEVPLLRKSVLKLITAKGCPNNCDFCQSPKWNELSSMEDALNAIETAWSEGIDTFYIADENFCPQRLSYRVISFCDLIKNSNVINRPINLKLFLEPQTPVSVLEYLKQVAYINAFVGFESFSDEALVFFGKKNSRRNNLLFWDNARKIGFNILPGIIALHPFSTPEELLDLINILAMYDALSWRLLLKKMDLYPGTALLMKIKKEFSNLLKTSFSPFLRPSDWDYIYDRHLGKPVMRSIEKVFTILGDKNKVKELYSLMFDLSFVLGNKKGEISNLYHPIQSNFIKLTKELAIKIVQIIKQHPHENFEGKLKPLISRYLEEVDIIFENCKNFLSDVIGDKK
jgi:hypothetical protein